jgi:hypothetical protein
MKKAIISSNLHDADFNDQQNCQQYTLRDQNNLWKQHTEINNALISIQFLYQLSATKTVALD